MMTKEEPDAQFEAIDEQIRSDIEATQAKIQEIVREETLRLQRRWGLISKDALRQLVEAIVRDTYNGRVTEIVIDGEQYHRILTDEEHILLEIAPRVKPEIIDLLKHKRTQYSEQTGITPTRMILAVAQIHYTVVERLQEIGIEVLQPEVLFEDENDTVVEP